MHVRQHGEKNWRRSHEKCYSWINSPLKHRSYNSRSNKLLSAIFKDLLLVRSVDTNHELEKEHRANSVALCYVSSVAQTTSLSWTVTLVRGRLSIEHQEKTPNEGRKCSLLVSVQFNGHKQEFQRNCWVQVQVRSFCAFLCWMGSGEDRVLITLAFFFLFFFSHESLKNGLRGSPAAAAPSGTVGSNQHCYTSLRAHWNYFGLFWPASIHPEQKVQTRAAVTPPEVRWDSGCRASRINWFKTRLAEGRESEASSGAPVCVSSGTAQQEMRSAEPPKAPPWICHRKRTTWRLRSGMLTLSWFLGILSLKEASLLIPALTEPTLLSPLRPSAFGLVLICN